MDLLQRKELLVRLGEYMENPSEELAVIKQEANLQNGWFTPEFIDLSIKNISANFLNEEKLHNWLKAYRIAENTSPVKNIGIVMAGNIPLVGFHDWLCVFISGFRAVIKPSSKDEVLIRHLVQKLNEWESETSQYTLFADQLKGCDAYIATGSSNSGRYFEYYFGKYPSIIRTNRTAVAVLEGNETIEQLNKLADDIQLYFGLGCRNVTKLYVPEGYDFSALLNALKKYEYFIDFHKYKHNYDYQLALLIMNSKFYMNNGSVILAEAESVFSPVSLVHFEHYKDVEVIKQSLKENKDIQCIVGNEFIDFGKSQSPGLGDYADGVDTILFLSSF